MSEISKQPQRDPVNYRFDQLNWSFLKGLARIANYANQKYGDARQYTLAKLTGEKSPVNHIIEHYRSYMAGEPHDILTDEGRAGHLVAIAYNAMMQYHYETGTTPGDIKSPVLGALELPQHPLGLGARLHTLKGTPVTEWPEPRTR